VTALRRRDASIRSGSIRVERAYAERSSGELLLGEPKSRAGKRTVVLPGPIVQLLKVHLRDNVGSDPDALVFAGDKGRPLRRSNFNRQARWTENVRAVGAPDLHFHDLRHTGNTLAAESGASLRDLMARMGHDSVQAAVIYQHRANGADRRIADAMEALIENIGTENDDPDDGAAGALVPTG
jgi:integrase